MKYFLAREKNEMNVALGKRRHVEFRDGERNEGGEKDGKSE